MRFTATCTTVVAVVAISGPAVWAQQPGPAVNAAAASLATTPDKASVRVGGTVTITADVPASEGDLAQTALTWAAQQPRIARILETTDRTATVRGESAGTTRIDIRHAVTGAAASVLVEVTDDPLAAGLGRSKRSFWRSPWPYIIGGAAAGGTIVAVRRGGYRPPSGGYAPPI
jgi:Flp pilus assembly secretin CpaC